MKVSSDFDIKGFERYDKGEQGVVFVRYSNRAQVPPQIQNTPLLYGGERMDSFVLSLARSEIVECAVIIRPSKNRYTVTAFKKDEIVIFKVEGLEELQAECYKFFKIYG